MEKEDYKKYLEHINFQKHLDYLKKILKDKKVIIYGLGSIFRYAKENFDLSFMDVIGVSDAKLYKEKEEDYLGYKVINRYKIQDYKPDYLIVATLEYQGIIDYFEEEEFSFDTEIKIIPLFKKNLIDSIAQKNKANIGRLRFVDNDKLIQEYRTKKYEKLAKILVEEKLNTNGIYDYLDKATKAKFSIKDTTNVSAHGYCEEAIKLIEKYKDGLILDCGSGFRPHYYENVVNYEICDYETTDVLGVGEELPFKDNSFDAVFSFAVFEHVTNPEKCAKEIARVLKPNGEFIFDACFMQPLHGYPDHYFNITPSGALLLFKDLLKLDKQYIPENFHPILNLKWNLRLWDSYLEGNAKKDFEKMTVKELLELSTEEALSKDFCQISDENRKFIAAGSRVIFHK